MTMIVTLATAVSVFVAADSRATLQMANGELRVKPGVFQKVDLAGPSSIVAASGLFSLRTALPGLNWDSMDTLREAASGLSGSFDAEFDELGRRYRDTTSKAISSLPIRMEGVTPGEPAIIDIYFAQRSLGQSYLAAEHIALASKPKAVGSGWDNSIATIKTERMLDGAASRKLIAREKAVIHASGPAYCPIATDQREAHVYFLQGKFVEWIRRVINQTAAQSPRCNDVIGGPIHIAVVDDRGARWAAPP